MFKRQFERVISVREERKYFIDNLRNITILLLFPVHTFMIWNDFGSRFYIWLGENKILSTLIVLVNPWFMPLLFVLAGVSARYALLKRTEKKFIAERIKKLLIPFLFGLVFFVPFQALYARKFLITMAVVFLNIGNIFLHTLQISAVMTEHLHPVICGLFCSFS